MYILYKVLLTKIFAQEPLQDAAIQNYQADF